MSSLFPPLPLGQRIPDSIHGVSCSLPTMKSVIGYEEKDPEITRHLTSGYPRFVYHPLLRQAAALILERLGLHGKMLWLTTSARMSAALVAHLGSAAASAVRFGSLGGVIVSEDSEESSRAKTFLQHVGGFLSSREAEDFLLKEGAIHAPFEEELYRGDAEFCVKTALSEAFGHGVDADHIFLAPSGMNAIYAAIRAVDAIQRPRGRKKWLQLGWLYLDTIAILQKFAADAESYLYLPNVFDVGALHRLFAEQGDQIAGVITEVPTNPLIQTPDLEQLASVAQAAGALVILDPTLASPLNIDILPYCDVAVNSLTKFTASEGDVVFGAAIVNPEREFSGPLCDAVRNEVEPVYGRDVARLAFQISNYAQVIEQTNDTTPEVVEFLRSHPAVQEVFWSLHPASCENYLHVARSPRGVGSMISFSLKIPLAQFYDRLRLPKGPSFGMKTSIICPFIYLAHYDLVTSEAGRKKLLASGLNPDLLRLSIGCEPAEAIIQALDEALNV